MGSDTVPKTITLKGIPIRKEGKAAATITPGMLVDFDTNGEKVPHATAGGNAAAAFALEQDFLGKGITDNYADNDLIQYGIFRPGDEVYALLETGNNVAKGDYLESNGAGALQKHTAQAVAEGGSASYTVYAKAIVARALEAVNNTSGANVRIKVEVV